MRGNIRKTMVLAGVSLLTCSCLFTARAEAGNDKAEKIQAKQERQLQKVSTKNKDKINHALQSCKRNGAESAKQLNKMKVNKRDFEAGVRGILDEYYSMDESQRGQLENFEATLDESAETIVEHYEEAEEERKNSDSLDYQTEEIVVRFPYGTSEAKIEEVVGEVAVDYEVIDSGILQIDESLPEYKKKRLEKIKDYKTDVVVLAKLGLEDTVARAEEKFENYGCVVDASENIFLEADGVVKNSYGTISLNDPYFNTDKQWHMKNINLAQASSEFNKEMSSTEIWVAVIDCGVQMNHPDLKGNLLTRYSVDVTNDKSVNKKLIDCADKAHRYGQYTGNHGTMVAGVIAARANNGKLGAGVASAATYHSFGSICKIMAIKCDNSVGSGRHITKAYLANAINYAVSEGAEVINISYSAKQGEYSAQEFKDVENAIKRAIAAGVCVVASAGNYGSSTPRYPASFEGVIGVGATLPNNKLTSYSNRSEAVDIVAPGGEDGVKKIFTTYPTTAKKCGYSEGRGTSFAAPQVAATAALMKDMDYDLTSDQILSKMKSSSTVSVKVSTDKGVKTFPLLNAGRAVRLARLQEGKGR